MFTQVFKIWSTCIQFEWNVIYDFDQIFAPTPKIYTFLQIKTMSNSKKWIEMKHLVLLKIKDYFYPQKYYSNDSCIFVLMMIRSTIQLQSNDHVFFFQFHLFFFYLVNDESFSRSFFHIFFFKRMSRFIWLYFEQSILCIPIPNSTDFWSIHFSFFVLRKAIFLSFVFKNTQLFLFGISSCHPWDLCVVEFHFISFKCIL